MKQSQERCTETPLSTYIKCIYIYIPLLSISLRWFFFSQAIILYTALYLYCTNYNGLYTELLGIASEPVPGAVQRSVLTHLPALRGEGSRHHCSLPPGSKQTSLDRYPPQFMFKFYINKVGEASVWLYAILLTIEVESGVWAIPAFWVLCIQNS